MKLRGAGSWFRLKPNTQKVWLTRVGCQTFFASLNASAAVWAFLYSFALSPSHIAFAETKAPAIIVPYDTITSPGIEVWPQAKVMVKKFYVVERPVAGERIEFFEGDRYLGLALTGGDGVGVIRYTPHSEGIHKIKVRLISTSVYEAKDAEMLVGVWGRGRPLLFVSINALREPAKEVIIPFIKRSERDTERRPMNQSVEILSDMSERFKIIYLYYGDLSEVQEIKSWLSQNKFPIYPILIWDDTMKILKKITSERRKDIKGAILTPDDEGDIFKKGEIKTLLLVEKRKRSEYKGIKDRTIVADWREIEKKID